MPTTHTTLTAPALSARLCRLAVEAQWIADELIACETSDVEFEALLAGPALAFTLLVDWLQDALLSRCDRDFVDCALSDRALARRFVEAHGSQPGPSSRSSR
jgi:hypothetical protein